MFFQQLSSGATGVGRCTKLPGFLGFEIIDSAHTPVTLAVPAVLLVLADKASAGLREPFPAAYTPANRGNKMVRSNERKRVCGERAGTRTQDHLIKSYIGCKRFQSVRARIM
jgi:hypothetical protein